MDESPNGISPVEAFTIPDIGDPTNVNTFKYQDRLERVDATGTQGGNGGTILANYVAIDPDGATLGDVTYRVAGPDGSDFIIGASADNDTARDGSAGNLRFKNHPNYDKPADENKDNVYELIVVASDPQLNVSTLWVTIKVTDVQEAGEVSFNKRQPAVGEPITAELEDPDGVVGTVSWQWHRVGAADYSMLLMIIEKQPQSREPSQPPIRRRPMMLGLGSSSRPWQPTTTNRQAAPPRGRAVQPVP